MSPATRRTRRSAGEWLQFGVGAALVAVMFYPTVWMVLSAFKATGEIYSSPFALPQNWDFKNVATIWRETRFVTYLGNSILVTGTSIAVMLTADLTAGQRAGVIRALDNQLHERSGGNGPATLTNAVHIGIGTRLGAQ